MDDTKLLFEDISVPTVERCNTNVIRMVHNSKLVADVTGGDCMCWDVDL